MTLRADADQVIQESCREERQALATLLDGGPPVRVRRVAEIAGISKTKVLQDGRSGEVVIRWVKCGTRKMGVIDRPEAYRYLVNIGITS